MKKQIWMALMIGALLLGSGCERSSDPHRAEVNIRREPLTVQNVSGKMQRLEQALLTALQGVAGQGSSPVQALDGAQVQNLEQEIAGLRQWAEEIKSLPETERQPLQQAWAGSTGTLRELALQIIQSSPSAADAYGPLLSELLELAKALSPEGK